MIEPEPAGSTPVPWLSLGVNPDDVDRTLSADAGAFVDRLSLGLLRRAFAPAGLGAIAAMTRDEAIHAIVRGVRAGHAPTVRALRRLALCHRLVSGKREDALLLVQDAVARLDPPVVAGGKSVFDAAAIPGEGDIPLREKHVALALVLLDRAPALLWLYPLLDRASRVAYRAYVPGEQDGPVPMRDTLARLSHDYVQEILARAFGPVDAPAVDGVYAVRAERFVFLRTRGIERIIATADGALVAPGFDQIILRFDPDGGLRAYGGALGVRIAERLLSSEGSVRYVPFRPETSRRSAMAWLGALIKGDDPHSVLEEVSLDFSSFDAQIAGDVSRGLQALAPDGEVDGSLERIRSLTLTHRASGGAASRYTVWVEPGSGPSSVAVTYRATGAALAERDEFERRLAAQGVQVSPRR